MKHALKAGFALSGSYLVSMAAGVATTKIAALALHADGFGLWMLIKNTVALGMIPAAAGIGVGLVRSGPRALEGDDAAFAALFKAARLLRLTWGGGVMILVLLMREPLSRLLLGSAGHASDLVLADAALGFSLTYDLHVSLLSVHRHVRQLALLTTVSASLGALTVAAILIGLGSRGIGISVLAASVAAWVTSHLVVRYQHFAAPSVGRTALKPAAAELIRFGLSYTASYVVVAGAQLAAPAIILHLAGTTEVAYYQAATLIGANYLGFMVAAAGQDYYPRLSAAKDNPAALTRMADEQQQLVLLVTVPIILTALAMAPYLIPLLYSKDFQPSVAVLNWLLFGDLLRFSSWTLAFIILVRRGSLMYFLTEAVWGVVFLGAGWPMLAGFGIAGFGVAYVLAYAAYLVAVWILVRGDLGQLWSGETRHLMRAGLLLVAIATVTSIAARGPLRLVADLSLALAASLVAARRLWNILRAPMDPW